MLTSHLSTLCLDLTSSLKPGANEITIYGLTPTADESSIKVDGKGSATITDMMVDLIPNRESYEDVYPSDSDDEDANDSDSDKDGSETESEAMEALAQDKKKAEASLGQANELGKSAASRLVILENYGRSVEKDRPSDLEACLRTYREEREKIFEDHKDSEARAKALEMELKQISKKQVKLRQAAEKEKQKALKKKTKNLEKKRRALQEKMQAKLRLTWERSQFWPKKVYRIVLSLDTNSNLTPASSRRGSIDSVAKPISEGFSPDSCQISLSVSYITHSASWSPRYDLSLDTPTSSGLIIYRAEFCNTTSETWRDTKVILSTSQTSFQGLGELIPTMIPWHIRLSKGFGGDGTIGALLSRHEQDHKRRGEITSNHKINEPRHALFGLGDESVQLGNNGSIHDFGGFQQPQQAGGNSASQDYQRQLMILEQQNKRRLMCARQEADTNNPPAQRGGGLFGTVTTSNAPNIGSSLFDSSTNAQRSMFAPQPSALQSASGAFQSQEMPEQSGSDDFNGGEPTIRIDLPYEGPLQTQESSWEETGLTATYDIPGLRSIAPSHTMRRHKIATINLKDVHLSHRLVPKLRAAAFFKAILCNNSSITLLKGPAGLTLDGSFLGNISIPRCSAGESFSISLGVDPSINVTYSKPVVKRSQTGVFQKEGSGVYTRTCTVTNTKSNKAIDGLVLDQIPVSEDERLKVDILAPVGLKGEGDSAKTGTAIATPNTGAKTVDAKWGRAVASLKKAGEVCWDIKLEPGRGVSLVLEYETKFPSGEMVTNI